jgi:hypothetical protein
MINFAVCTINTLHKKNHPPSMKDGFIGVKNRKHDFRLIYLTTLNMYYADTRSALLNEPVKAFSLRNALRIPIS